MNSPQDNDQDEVVVVEQRDKFTLAYIALAAVIGLAGGGLIGSTITESKWQNRYEVLESKLKQSNQQQEQLTVQVEEKVTTIEDQVASRVEEALEKERAEHELQLKDVNKQVTALEKANIDLEQRIAEQDTQIIQASADNDKLVQQADMQASMFERSREIFQREFKIKYELEALRTERDELRPKISQLKKDCDVFLSGKSWDAKTDACDKQDEAQSRITHIDQMIQVHLLDLKQIEQLAEDIGM
ncbi:chromosome partitioning protein ParA [Vibrio maerlii]|uniref:chromosome partitioning protein ParA n=1 Tax=Vibrio maerlii TaxID=2231648 RepID=UPI000E3E06BF|nr:chromosome partitioning protein ParA [Vibrio maerlii]